MMLPYFLHPYVPRNTKDEGTLTFFTYRDEEEGGFVTVILEMDVVKIDQDIEISVKDAVRAAEHLIQLVNQDKLSEDVLNKPAPREYWDRYSAAQPRPSILTVVRNKLKGMTPVSGFARIERLPLAGIGSYAC